MVERHLCDASHSERQVWKASTRTAEKAFVVSDCEQLLGRDEKQFCEQIFIPYHERDQQAFRYGSWLRRFVVALHWKVLVTRNLVYPQGIEIAFSDAEKDWRRFLLGESDSLEKSDIHIFFLAVIKDASGPPLPTKMNWYFARSIDSTPFHSESGNAGVYAKLVKIMTVSFLTVRDRERERWKGTEVHEEGMVSSPQSIETLSLGPFLEERARIVEHSSGQLTPRQREAFYREALRDPGRISASESARTALAVC